LVSIPLIISAFTHLFNPVGFPCVHYDEAVYLGRSMYVLQGLGPQDPASRFDHSQASTSSYDHPYFGQLFLAGIFKLIGYPNSFVHTSATTTNDILHSIEMLYFVPRVLMGLLAVVDTFLVYKIAERRYSRNVAVIASVLFAVMPLSWLIRRIYLDTILLPFLLSSILFAIYYNRKDSKSADNKYGDGSIGGSISDNKTLIPTLLSGIFLGLAIFTKIPAFTMIPLVGFLIFTNNSNKKRLKVLGLWFIPVILIPLIWPLYAAYNGQFYEWLNGISYQGKRGIHYEGDVVLPNALNKFFQIDPVLFALGICGLFYVAIKKDVALLLWVIPYLIFLYVIVWTTYFHLIIILPVFCIAFAVLLEDLLRVIRRKIMNQRILLSLLSPPVAITSIGIFGLKASITLIIVNLTFNNFVIFAFIIQQLPDFNDSRDSKLIMVGSPYLRTQYWLYKYAFSKDFDFMSITDPPINDTHFIIPFNTQKVLFIIDSFFSQIHSKGPLEQIQRLYNGTYTKAIFQRVEIRSNY
jgi:hypothetical protein